MTAVTLTAESRVSRGSAIAQAARLTLRLHRVEMTILTALTVLGVVLTLFVSAQLAAVGYGTECLEAGRTGAPTPPACEFKANRFYELVSGPGSIVQGINGFVPLIAGLLLGVSVVGRELERGTTRLAWALTPSRLRWLAQRLLPVLLFVTTVGLVLGAAADHWLAAAEPGLDPANAFSAFGSRGPVLAARGVFVFAVAVVVGALVGRALPSVMVAGLIAIVGLTGGSQVHQRIMTGEAIVIDEGSPGDWFIDQRFRLPDGRLIGWEEVEQHDPPPAVFDDTTVWPTLPTVTIGLPGSWYGGVALREVGALAGGSLVALVATAAIVRRRRPG